MKLEGKTVIITSNSSVFLKLTKLFIEKESGFKFKIGLKRDILGENKTINQLN